MQLTNKIKLGVVTIAVCILNFNSVFSCTGIGVKYDDKYFVGKNHDWVDKNAAIVVNPREIIKHAICFKREDKQLEWVSKYGSITVNLKGENGHVVPGAMVGMNEKGLSVLALWLAKSKYPSIATKAVIPTELFADYFLDNAATVTQAIELAKKIEVEPSTLPDTRALQLAKTFDLAPNTFKGKGGDINLHLFVQDEKGNTAILEYLNGELVVYTGKDIFIRALTNDPYKDSIQYIKQFKEFGGNSSLPGEFDSLHRFAKAAYALKTMPNIKSELQAISYTFNALSYAQNPIPNTQWTAVFDLTDKALYLRSIDNQQIRVVRLNKFDISKGQPIKFLSVNNDLSGYVENKFSKLNHKM